MPRVLIKDLDSTEKGTGSDMSLYFGNTFVRVSPDGSDTPRWAKYNGFHGPKGAHLFADASGKVVEVPHHDPKAYVEWHYPTGWFNALKSSIYCERIPKRQYLKGLHNGGNFKISSAESVAKECGFFQTDDEKAAECLSCVSSSKFQLSIQQVEKVFSGINYPPFEEAYLMMREKVVFSRALSKELCMMPHPESKDFVVFCHDFPVAELLTKNKLKMFLPEYKPECMAYFLEQGVSVVS